MKDKMKGWKMDFICIFDKNGKTKINTNKGY